MRSVAISALAVVCLFASACEGPEPKETKAAEAPAPTPGPGEPTLEEVRALTEKYKDVKVAEADGYILAAPICDTADMMGKPASAGAMGLHYFIPAQAGVTAPPNPRVDGNGVHTDFRKPTVLIYEPQADGSLTLVAVENLVFEAAWKAAGHTSPPTFHGKDYDHMADDPATPLDEAHNFMPHYDRHVWVHRENPNGVFTSFNPAVSCQHYKGPPMPPMKGMKG